MLAAPHLLLIRFSDLEWCLLLCPCCAWDESRCFWSYGVIWILKFQFDLTGFFMKIVSLLPKAVEEEEKILTTQKCCIWSSVSFLSLSVTSAFWLQTVIVLARMLRLSNTLNHGCVLKCWVLSSTQNPWKFLQWLLQCSLQACLQHPFEHQITACSTSFQQWLLVSRVSFWGLTAAFSKTSPHRWGADSALAGPIKAGNKLLCSHSTFYYCSLAAWQVSAQHWGSKANVLYGWLSWIFARR